MFPPREVVGRHLLCRHCSLFQTAPLRLPSRAQAREGLSFVRDFGGPFFAFFLTFLPISMRTLPSYLLVILATRTSGYNVTEGAW